MILVYGTRIRFHNQPLVYNLSTSNTNVYSLDLTIIRLHLQPYPGRMTLSSTYEFGGTLYPSLSCGMIMSASTSASGLYHQRQWVHLMAWVPDPHYQCFQRSMAIDKVNLKKPLRCLNYTRHQQCQWVQQWHVGVKVPSTNSPQVHSAVIASTNSAAWVQ